VVVGLAACGDGPDAEGSDPETGTHRSGGSNILQTPVVEAKGEGSAKDLATRVNSRYSQAILASFPGAVGHGVGAFGSARVPGGSEPAQYAIVVLLANPQDLPSGDFSVAGVPIDFQVTGSLSTEVESTGP
jgi:hypothetical protein